ALLVIDGERGRLLLVEGAQALLLAAGALQWHAAQYHRRDRQPRTDLIQERIGVLHGRSELRLWPRRHRRIGNVTDIHFRTIGERPIARASSSMGQRCPRISPMEGPLQGSS